MTCVCVRGRLCVFSFILFSFTVLHFGCKINIPIDRLTVTSFRHFIYASCSGRHVVWQGNVNILQHLQWHLLDDAGSKLFLNLLIQILFQLRDKI